MIDLIHRNAQVLPDNLNLFDYKDAGSALVISPHPDDDVIACGGNIKLCAEKDMPVFSIYITNGADTPAAAKHPKKKIIETRKAEAFKALKIVGGVGGFFLGYDSAELSEGRAGDASKDIFNILMMLRPDIIYTPSPFDNHITHLLSTEILLQATRVVPDYFPKLRGYTVWGSMMAPKEFVETVDLTSVIETKRKAIKAHTSEIEAHAYDEGAVAANRQTAVFASPHHKQNMEYAGKLLIMDELVQRPELGLEVFGRNLALHYLHDIYAKLPNIGKEIGTDNGY